MKQRLLNYSELGKAVGSKRGLDPIPPDQYQSKMDPRYPPHERLLAWVTANTMGEGHRAAYCVDAHGRELTLADARRDLKLDGSLAKRTWKYLEQEGRVREHKGRLYLCGEVNLPATEIVPEFGLDSPESDCTVRVSTYILNKLKELPKVQQQKYWSWRKAKTAKYLVVRRELIALQRLMEEQEEDSVLLSLGIEPKHQKKRRAEPVAHLPLFQPLIASIVQSSDGDDSSPTVQSANPRLSNPENGSVQDVSRAPSLLIEKSREDIAAAAVLSTEDSPPPLPDPSVPKQLQDSLNATFRKHNLPLMDEEAAKRIVAELPNLPAAEILELCEAKLAQNREDILSGKIKNPIAFLIRTVPLMRNNCAQGAHP